jgi:hypothetical protein
LGTDTNALAQLIFQHWKTALSFGYAPTPHLLVFYRGLFSVARVARELAPAEDPLRDGTEELDADMMFEQLTDITGTTYWSESADKFATAMINLPQTLDEALNRGSSLGFDNHLAPAPEHPASKRAKPIAMLVLFISAIIFIFQTGTNGWMEQTVVLALMLAGLAGLQMLVD